MTEISQTTDHGAQNEKSTRPLPESPRLVAAVHVLLFLVGAAVAVRFAHTAKWDWAWVAILSALAVISEFTATALPSGQLNISGSFLGITLAAVLLGGPPAAIVGALTIVIGWFRWRERPDLFRNNLVTFTWFPLASGLLFHGVTTGGHVGESNPSYYLLVFGTFIIALALNLSMIAAYDAILAKTSLLGRLSAYKPVMSAELTSAILAVIAAYLTNHMGTAGLGLFAIVLVVFQYLVRELLLSQRRGEELEVMATTDELTGLANRKQFNDHVDAVIAAAAEGNPTTFGVLLIDLDHFKDINDTLGHQYGDDLLADLGPRLAKRIGEGGLVARFGGDEFGIMPAVRTENTAALTAIVEDVMACLREPVTFDDITLEVDASIGVARYPHDGGDAQTLLRRADIAMYSAKADRDSHRFYAPGQDRHSHSRLSMVGDFRRALEKDDEIIVHFHPIVDLGSGRIHGAEALVRWQHPELGLLQPGAFLEIVEQTGLIGEMTTCVLEKAIAECAAWHAAGRDLTMSVNLSVRNLHDPMISSQVAQMLERHCLPAAALKLEITESMILSDPQRALATVQSLSEIGVRFAVDDFGTGHSSLANLRMLPVHELKVDRSFVTPMLNEESDLVIVRSTIELGHALGLKVIAEGVEDAVTLAKLAEIGCDRAQGHFFSKPLPPIEFMRWISRYEHSYTAAA
ncbi:MAG: EAL domain-containing protein [Acidobacteriota bacterium]|nr:EAL domain-containing protein [Acidobacteriota bacterium]